MSGNTFGKNFKVTTFGESHGYGIGCIIDGCPSNIEISIDEIQAELDLRRPGQSSITTDRNEDDKIEILSGFFEGKTTGTPICLLIKNKDQQSQDYGDIKNIFRPSHADYVYQVKYGIRDHRGGGRSSARETAARVAAGAIAKKILYKNYGIEILSYVSQVYNIKSNINPNNVKKDEIFSNIVRCPNQQDALKMIELIEQMKGEGDSVGGIICGLIKNCPIGIGEPVFDRFHAVLGHAMLSINAVKGFEIGDGFSSVNLKGSEHNDELTSYNGKISTKTNHAGGVVGGITNGENIIFNVAFKPVSTIKKSQDSVNIAGENIHIKTIKGRHDPCVLPRAIPIVDAMSALTILDFIL